METKALFALEDHAAEKLYPFQDKLRHLAGTDTDFHTEVELFSTNILIAFRELKRNIVDCPEEDIRKYIRRVSEILKGTREQVNQYFGADNEYNKRLQQIEAEGVTEDPESGLTPADSKSETNLEYPAEPVALYLNKVCLWWIVQFQQHLINADEQQRLLSSVKLAFVCQNKQVYYLFRWLKSHGWISNTNDEIINFLISHTTFKGDMPTYSTIRAELTRADDLPETKKFNPPTE